VYVAPLYHRLRLLEEICMLDQMSGGRLEIAFGRGALPAEVRFFDVDPAQTEKVHQEMVGFILEGLSEGAVTVTAESGKRRLPLAIPPLQKPHPPLWYGIHSPQAAERAARRGMNVLGLDTTAELKPVIDRFRAVWKETHGDALPKIGLGRFVVVGRDANDGSAAALDRLVGRRSDDDARARSRAGRLGLEQETRCIVSWSFLPPAFALSRRRSRRTTRREP